MNQLHGQLKDFAIVCDDSEPLKARIHEPVTAEELRQIADELDALRQPVNKGYNDIKYGSLWLSNKDGTQVMVWSKVPSDRTPCPQQQSVIYYRWTDSRHVFPVQKDLWVCSEADFRKEFEPMIFYKAATNKRRIDTSILEGVQFGSSSLPDEEATDDDEEFWLDPDDR